MVNSFTDASLIDTPSIENGASGSWLRWYILASRGC